MHGFDVRDYPKGDGAVMQWIILALLFFIMAVSLVMGLAALARSAQLGRAERERHGERYD